MNQETIKVPWAHGPMDPWAHGPMGPWAHEVAPRSRTTKPITFFPKLSIDEAHNILSKIIHSFDIFPYIPICPWLHFLYIPICPWLHFLYIPICPGLNPLYIPYMSMVIPSLLSTLCGLLGKLYTYAGPYFTNGLPFTSMHGYAWLHTSRYIFTYAY